MRSRNRSLAILICLFLVSFKVAAGSVFIDAAIERAQMRQAFIAGVISDYIHESKDTSDGEQQSHSLFLMSHVTANISDTGVVVPFISTEIMFPGSFTEILFTQNFPDSAFKPPKVSI
jgi:hypothetical protein